VIYGRDTSGILVNNVDSGIGIECCLGGAALGQFCGDYFEGPTYTGTITVHGGDVVTAFYEYDGMYDNASYYGRVTSVTVLSSGEDNGTVGFSPAIIRDDGNSRVQALPSRPDIFGPGSNYEITSANRHGCSISPAGLVTGCTEVGTITVKVSNGQGCEASGILSIRSCDAVITFSGTPARVNGGTLFSHLSHTFGQPHWSLEEGTELGATINQNSGTITPGTKAGVLLVKCVDDASPACTAMAKLTVFPSRNLAIVFDKDFLDAEDELRQVQASLSDPNEIPDPLWTVQMPNGASAARIATIDEGTGLLTALVLSGKVVVKVHSAALPKWSIRRTLDLGCADGACSGVCVQANAKPLPINGKMLIDLGGASFLPTAAHLSLDMSRPKIGMSSRTNLVLAAEGFDVVRLYESNAIRQVCLPKVVIQVAPTGTCAIRFYYTNQISSMGSNGLCNLTGEPYLSWTLCEPGGTTNTLLLISERSGTALTNAYTWNGASWDVSLANALTTHLTGANGSSVTNKITQSNGSVVAEAKKQFTIFPWGRRKVQSISGTQTNTWEYYSDANDTNNYKRIHVTSINGHWKTFRYDSFGRATNIVEQLANNPLATNATAEASNRVVTISYADGTNQPAETSVTTLNGFEIERAFKVIKPGEVQSIKAASPGVAWNATNNLVTTTFYYTDGESDGEVKAISYPNNIWEMRTYSISNEQRKVTVRKGIPNAEHTEIVNGEEYISLTDKVGTLLNRAIWQVVNSNSTLRLYAESVAQQDELGRSTVKVFHDGTTETNVYSCCGITEHVSREGVREVNTYDALQRLITSTVNGITISNVYDAADNVTAQHRIGTNGAVMMLKQYTYDLAGKLTREDGPISTFSRLTESFGMNGVVTQTMFISTNGEQGVFKHETFYADGQTQTISGDTVHPVRFEYGVDTNGTFVKEIKLNTNGTDLVETITTYFDFLGRPARRVFADNAEERWYYDSGGRLMRFVDADGVTTLYAYNGLGEREYTVVDVNRNGIIDFAGDDRIVRTLRYITNGVNGAVRRTETWRWTTEGVDSAVLLHATESSLDGLTNWTSQYGVTKRTEILNSPNGVRRVKTIEPAGAFSVSRYDGGRLVEIARTNGVSRLESIAFGYDEYGRQKWIADARMGTTTTSFDDLDRVRAVTSPPVVAGGSPTTIGYQLDALGRITAITNEDGAISYRTYTGSGELKSSWGAGEYPVDYTYDSQGRIGTMKTWQKFSANSGTAITTWKYDAYRGFLTNKTYASTNGPFYRYTSAGRLYQRVWARGTTTTYTTNSSGDIAVIDYSDATPDVTYLYDRLGRRRSVSDGAGNHVIVYDQANNILNETNTSGLLTGFGVVHDYDSLLRHNRSVLCDANGARSTNNYAYDNASRIVGVTNGPNSATFAYLADAPGVEQIIFKNGSTTRLTTLKTFDLNNRLNSVRNYPSADQTVAFDYNLNSISRRIAVTNADGARWTYGYDSIGQVTSGKKFWSDGNLILGQQFEYAFDDIGNRLTATSGGDENEHKRRTQIYAANGLNQITNRTVPGFLDIVGTATNAAFVTVNNVPTSRKGDYFRAELSVDNSSGSLWQEVTNVAVQNLVGTDIVTNTIGFEFVSKNIETFGYDPDGNQTNDGRWIMTWDGENRLTKLESLPGAPVGSSNRITFSYDSQSRRIAKTVERHVNGAWSIVLSNRFLYDGWDLIGEINATNATLVSTFVWGLDIDGSARNAGGVGSLLLMNVISVGTFFYGYDGSGNVATLIDSASGQSVAEYEYDPFGRILRSTGAVRDRNPFRYSTKYFDDTTSFIYFGYRYYSPAYGRWLSRDPIEEEGGPGLYAFVYNNPVLLYDLLGLDPLLPKNGTHGFWKSGQPGNGEYLHGRVYEKYKKTIPFENNQPNLRGFANANEVPVNQPFDRNERRDFARAEAELKARNPGWTKPVGHEWHHFTDATGQRYLQLVPGDVNSVKHRNPEVADFRKKYTKKRPPAGFGQIAMAVGMLGTAYSLANVSQEEVNEIKKNMLEYLDARANGQPYDDLGYEIATGFCLVFQQGSIVQISTYFYLTDGRRPPE
jgi:RHS repeat-associated protein